MNGWHIVGYAGLMSLGITVLLVLGKIVALLIVLRDTEPAQHPRLIEALATLFAFRHLPPTASQRPPEPEPATPVDEVPAPTSDQTAQGTRPDRVDSRCSHADGGRTLAPHVLARKGRVN